jgi:predicted alpha/beta superfamily hydrolase
MLNIGLIARAQYPAVQIPHSQIRNIHAASDAQDYQLYILLPDDYPQSIKKYAVLYVLDGQWNFSTVCSLGSGLYGDGAIPAMIVVGVTWAGDHPDYDSLRQREFTPVATKEIPYGGHAASFLEAFQKDIIPFVDSAYHTDTSSRTLIGGSLGTLFAGYVLFHSTGLFQRYIMASPALDYAGDTVVKEARRYAAGHKTLSASVFIGAGAWDRYLPATHSFILALKAGHYPGLHLVTKEFERMGHATGIGEGINQGLLAIFARTAIALAPSKLDRYAGIYEHEPGDSIRLYRIGDSLFMQYSKTLRFVMSPETANDFFIRGIPLFFTFSVEPNEEVAGLLIKYIGGEAYYKKKLR